MWCEGSDDVDSALGLLLPAPATFAAGPGLRARRAPDRRIARIVERMVGKIVLEDVAPDVLLGPVGERIELPDPAGVVVLELGRRGARRRLFTPDSGDPRVDAAQRLLQSHDLGFTAAP